MGLVGIRCPDDDETYSFEECLACAKRGGPRSCHHPIPLLVAMQRNAEDRKDAGISATMLLDCPRKVILAREEDYYERPADYYPRFRGTMGHLMMEHYSGDLDGVVQEQRIRKTIDVDGVQAEITGKPDWVDINRKLIVDFKSCTSLERKPINQGIAKEGHREQVSLYRWLLAGGTNMVTGDVVNYEIDKGGILYFSMSGSRKIAVDLWSLEETEEYIRDRLRPHIQYETTGVMPPFLLSEKGKRHYFCNFCVLRDRCDERGE